MFQRSNRAQSCLELPFCFIVIECKLITWDNSSWSHIWWCDTWMIDAFQQRNQPVLMKSFFSDTLTGACCRLFSLQTGWPVPVTGKAQVLLITLVMAACHWPALWLLAGQPYWMTYLNVGSFHLCFLWKNVPMPSEKKAYLVLFYCVLDCFGDNLLHKYLSCAERGC